MEHWTYLLLILERECVLLLNENRGRVHCLLIANFWVLFMFRKSLNFHTCRATVDRHGNPECVCSTMTSRDNKQGTRHLSLTIAQNRGAIGSIIFLLSVHIESHSRETTA